MQYLARLIKEEGWPDKPSEQKVAVCADRRRMCGEYGKNLQRLRWELAERNLAHVCKTGNA